MENLKHNLITKTFKKAISVCLALIILLLTGCDKKEAGRGAEQSDDYYFKATLGGRKIVYRAANFQGGGNDDRCEHIVVGGFEGPWIPGDPIGPDGLSFEIWRLGGNIGPGQYSTPAEKNMTAKYTIQTEGGTIIYNTYWADDLFNLKIDAISKQGIKGSFSGTVRNQEGKAVSITEGSFNLPYEDLINP